jgi:hypothetical protein
VRNLAQALQSYAHFSPDLLQWNLNMVTGLNESGSMVAAIGFGHVDQARAARLQVLRGVLLWMLAQLMLHSDASIEGELQLEADRLRSTLRESGWLISKEDWADNLIPHLYDAPGAQSDAPEDEAET